MPIVLLKNWKKDIKKSFKNYFFPQDVSLEKLNASSTAKRSHNYDLSQKVNFSSQRSTGLVEGSFAEAGEKISLNFWNK